MWIGILGGILGLCLLAMLFYWAFIITEGAYLGARVVAWTYDLTAKKYDQIKQFKLDHDVWLIVGPLLHKLRDVQHPLILDVATGTGRLPLSLFSRPTFDGQVIGLDLSRKMLEQADRKLQEHAGRYTLVWHDAQRLPFDDETFDVVCCLEALEFMPDPLQVLSEMARVLRPGGIFLVTNRVNWEAKLMPGKAFSKDQFRAMLKSLGLLRIEFRLWQVYYDLIFALKPGRQAVAGKTRDEIRETLAALIQVRH
ncbi:MAG: class I SAM-dependent methyltransferase [Anaerolineae bacterium]|nr:class I SAM-dependent methyltransferase [Anaerolineae bacterium]